MIKGILIRCLNRNRCSLLTFAEERTRNPGEGEFTGVPGELRGFETAWKRYGSLPWKDLFRHAIKIATEGFMATPALIAAVEKNAPNVTNDPGLRLEIPYRLY